MKTVKIPQEDWRRQLDEFSLMHEGWLVSLDVLSESIGAQPEFHLMPLVGVTAEPGGGGAISALEIESADGTKAILRFRTAALPETVDAR